MLDEREVLLACCSMLSTGMQHFRERHAYASGDRNHWHCVSPESRIKVPGSNAKLAAWNFFQLDLRGVWHGSVMLVVEVLNVNFVCYVSARSTALPGCAQCVNSFNCSDNNTCICTDGYTGDFCQTREFWFVWSNSIGNCYLQPVEWAFVRPEKISDNMRQL